MAIEASEDYKEALFQTQHLLDPAIGLSKHDSSSSSDKVIIRQLNTVITLITNLHHKVNKLEDRIQLIEDKLQGTPKDIQELIESIKSTSIRKPRLQIGPQKFQVVSSEYSKDVTTTKK